MSTPQITAARRELAAACPMPVAATGEMATVGGAEGTLLREERCSAAHHATHGDETSTPSSSACIRPLVSSPALTVYRLGRALLGGR